MAALRLRPRSFVRLIGLPLNAAANSACVMPSTSRASSLAESRKPRAESREQRHARRERLLAQLAREPPVPLTHVLGCVAVYPCCCSARNRGGRTLVHNGRQLDWLAGSRHGAVS